MTPDVTDWQIVGNRLVELSKGYGIDGTRIYGVTEMEYNAGNWETTKKGQMFTGGIKARKYYKVLLNK